MPVFTYVLNPKAITMGQLYGEYDLDTHEWTDGILSTLIRAGTEATDGNKRWYVFDGPVDAVWIENMNTVLDDNKKLCLTSGEIMKLQPTQTMIFEVADLRVASPATVSRCGMVYMEPEGLGLKPFVNCWIKSLPTKMQDNVETIKKLTNELLFPGIKILREQLKEIITTVDSAIIQSYINLMNYRIGPMAGREGKPPPALVFQKTIPDLLSPWAAFATVWSLGATCGYDGRYIFSMWLRDVQNNFQHKLPFPEDGLVYDYRLHDGGFTDSIEGQDPIPPQWIKWSEGIPIINITPETKYADIEIPTMDNIRHAALIEYLFINNSNVLCIGPTGSGKTMTISSKLSRNMPKKFICDFIIFSARTTANQTQDLIDGKLDKRRRDVYGPPLLKKQIFFIDDFNMPALETFGAQPPIELIRQFMDFNGWYDRKEIGSFRLIEDVNFIGAMGPPGGGRNPVTPRLLRHFHFIAFPEMEDSAKANIFGIILNSWLSRTPTYISLLKSIVNITLNVFSTICRELLPTPDKSHYTYNLRDLSKVFQGILMADPTKINSYEHLFLLWYHENTRVFSDRLINQDDRNWFSKLLNDTLKEQFDYDITDLTKDKVLFYGDFCGVSGQYERITNFRKMEHVLFEFLEDYNNITTAPMKLVLFQDAVDHICRIIRILRQPRGNGLLLGMGGSGRQSLTKLSCHIREYNYFQIELSKAYSNHDWHDDIKSMMLKAGLESQIMVFLFSDTQIKGDFMLEDLNNILNNGDVPNIYSSEEIERIFQAMRGPVQEAGLQINRSNLFSTYLKVIKNNLHTMITMSPIGELFRARIRQFPALVNCCTIDWFFPWPDAALQAVAMYFLANIKDESINETVLKSIVTTCQFMHSSVIKASDRFLMELNRHNYVTPTSYLQLLSGYGGLLSKKKQNLHFGMTRLSTGLNKLISTEAEVKEMQGILKEMKPDLEQAAVATAKMIIQITKDTTEAEQTRAEAMKQEEVATKLKNENQLIRDEAETDLSEAKPMLDAAEASLKALNKGDITEVKAMKRPPVGVLLVIEAMCIVNNVKPNRLPGKQPGEKILDYWTPGSQMLADAGHFLNMMVNFNKENITEEMINKLKHYIEDPNFQPPKILQVSKACHSLCLWIHAMYNYYFVNLKVKPKMETLAKAEEILAETENALLAAMNRLQEVERRVQNLKDTLQDKENKKAELEKQKQLCEERMARAVKLVSGLAEEQQRWTLTLSEMKISLKNVVGDILLSSGAIAYLTPFTDVYRKTLLTSWHEAIGDKVPHTPNCTPISTLGDPVLIRRWQLDGLPRDLVSVENAVLVMHSERWPLFIDPQGQANKWIRKTYKDVGLSVTKMTSKDILHVLESCIRFGKPCLIENVGIEFESVLDPILMRSYFKHAGQISIKVGDNVVPYNPEFRLFLTTKLPNPHYMPEVLVKVLLVNFALTASGLLDQMMSLVTIQERPDLEQIRNSLIVSNAEMKKDLKELEDRILYRLTTSEGSTVDDIDLILTLDASKAKSEEIKTKVKAAEETQLDIESTRSLYIPVADRAQILFFCLYDLQYIDTMYQYSLEWFISIFNNSILSVEKTSNLDERIANILKRFTFDLFCNVCRSLFERHKLHFAFLVCGRIRVNAKLIDPVEWRHFLSEVIPILNLPNPAPKWISPRCWKEIQALEVLPNFKEFVTSFRELLTPFRYIFDTQEAHLIAFPEPWQTKLDDFQKMLVLKCLRPDKIINAIQMYLSKYLGKEFVEPQTTEISALYKESTPITPLVFVLSTGTDPAVQLYTFAEKQKMDKRLFSISLGQGQGPRAEAMLKQSAELGNWVFFQNCHLAPSWMPHLEALVEILTEKTHRDFRLWLTSAPSPDFPVSILQNGHKMTMEPPRGVKANLFRAYLTQVIEMKNFLESEHPKVESFKYLVFSLCLFHSLLLERRKFGSLGFNIPYEFTSGDLAICLSQLHMFLMEYTIIPFKEAKRYNGLLKVIRSSLDDLLKALKGSVVMSESLETMNKNISNNKIPIIWQDKGYPSLKPLGAWFLDLKERIKFINAWYDNGIPPAFWISGFYFPQAFLTATLQNYARKYIISIDTIDFNFVVLPSIPMSKPEDGCVVYGLFLEGCRWGGTYLEESHPKELYTEMSPILLLPEINHKVFEDKIYICPVYKTIARAGTLSTTGHSTNFVLAMEIPSKNSQAHWIKRGVAMICALNY